MKTIATILFFLLVGVAAQAQTDVQRPEVATLERTVFYVPGIEEKQPEKEVEIARIYKYKISRIKKTLSFTAKKNDAKVV